MRATLLRATLAAGLAAGAALAPAAAYAAPAEERCTEPGQVITPVPWPQQMLGPERVWAFTRGAGVTVAVLGSGVDARQPALAGRVDAGFDAVANRGRADSDCSGPGTQVAAVIAARQQASVGFVGMAPDVRILPVRVQDERAAPGDPADARVLARGIDAAVARGADVVAVPVVTYSPTAALQAAVGRALARGVVVVAAVGDLGGTDDPNPDPYPAAYEGVIGVGAIREAGDRWPQSQHGEYVDVVAPGVDVVTAQRGGGMVVVDGTGVATGFAAGVVALARAKRGDLPPAELATVVFATALPAPAGDAYGHGIVNPYGAVNDQVAGNGPEALPSLVRPGAGGPDVWAGGRRLALIGAGLAALVVIAVLVVATAVPRGRRRRWRTAVAPAPPVRPEPDEPGPPVQLF